MGGQNPIFFIGFHRRTRATAYRSPLGLSLLYSGGPAANFEGWPGLSTQDGTSGDSQRQGTRAPPTSLSLPQNADGSRSGIVRAYPSRDSIAGRHRGRMRPSRIDLHPLLGTGHCRQRAHSCPDRSQQRVRRVRAGLSRERDDRSGLAPSDNQRGARPARARPRCPRSVIQGATRMPSVRGGSEPVAASLHVGRGLTAAASAVTLFAGDVRPDLCRRRFCPTRITAKHQSPVPHARDRRDPSCARCNKFD
jgi:hypothetical protein